MSCTSITRLIGGAVSRFAKANDGNVAIIFGIAVIPLITCVGAAIDFSRVTAARSAMQSALDSTALMVAKDLTSGVIQPADVNATAQSYFNGLYTNKDAQDKWAITPVYTPASGNTPATIRIDGSGHINSDFLQLANLPTLSFGTSSTSTWGDVKMRVALALDNTGSMAQNGKITALRNAVAGTNGLVDQLSKLVKTPGDVYISVIPFAKVVNAGNVGTVANSIDWTDWLNPPTQQPNNGSYQATLPMNWHAVGPGANCPFTSGFSCTSSPVNGSSNVSRIPSSGTYAGYICPGQDANSHTFYNGCWDSEPTNQIQTFCSGSNSCSCNGLASSSSCTCTGSGALKSCSAYTYVHNWTQPGPNDSTHDLSQPRVSAPVGYSNNSWTASNSTPTVQNNWTQASTNPISTWTKCVADRTQPYDAQSDQPTSDVATQFPANQYAEGNSQGNYCSSSPQLEQIMPLSYDWTSLKTAVNAMQPTGGTDQAIGLAWAWQSLIPGGPLNTPTEDATTTYTRVIILLSDGLNTEDRWPEYGNGSNQTTTYGNSRFPGSIDARQQALCDNLKSARDARGNSMYTIYTIQVNTSTPADPTSSILQYCASSPDKFYELTSSSQIVTTFNTIGTALSKLRVAY